MGSTHELNFKLTTNAYLRIAHIRCQQIVKITDMNIEITETEARHLIRLIDKELTIYKNRQSVVSDIRLRELRKKLQQK